MNLNEIHSSTSIVKLLEKKKKERNNHSFFCCYGIKYFFTITLYIDEKDYTKVHDEENIVYISKIINIYLK